MITFTLALTYWWRFPLLIKGIKMQKLSEKSEIPSSETTLGWSKSCITTASSRNFSTSSGVASCCTLSSSNCAFTSFLDVMTLVTLHLSLYLADKRQRQTSSSNGQDYCMCQVLHVVCAQDVQKQSGSGLVLPRMPQLQTNSLSVAGWQIHIPSPWAYKWGQHHLQVTCGIALPFGLEQTLHGAPIIILEGGRTHQSFPSSPLPHTGAVPLWELQTTLSQNDLTKQQHIANSLFLVAILKSKMFRLFFIFSKKAITSNINREQNQKQVLPLPSKCPKQVMLSGLIQWSTTAWAVSALQKPTGIVSISSSSAVLLSSLPNSCLCFLQSNFLLKFLKYQTVSRNQKWLGCFCFTLTFCKFVEHWKALLPEIEMQ